MFELLTSLICLSNLDLSRLNETKFAFFYITEEQMLSIDKFGLSVVYNLIKECKVIITFKDNSTITVKPTRQEKCIGYSAISNKPRLLFFHNPNNITDTVLSVQLVKL